MAEIVRRLEGLDRPERTLSDRAYQHLRHDIVAGRLSAGSKLKLERLVADYGIGMSPLREGLARLVGDFLVVSEGQRGFWVAPLSLEELDEVWRLRALLEGEALARAIQLATDEWEAEVRSSFSRLAALEETMGPELNGVSWEMLSEWENRNRAFHATLISACGSPWLIRLRDLASQHCERYRRIALKAGPVWRSPHEEHHALFEAAMQRNVLKACRMLDIHLFRAAEDVRRTFAENPHLLT